jgi:hypothetical protein
MTKHHLLHQGTIEADTETTQCRAQNGHQGESKRKIADGADQTHKKPCRSVQHAECPSPRFSGGRQVQRSMCPLQNEFV